MIKKGDFVKLHFVGRLESGEIFDLTREDIAKNEKIYDKSIKYGPITIIIGESFLLPGIEKNLIGMNIGEKKEFILEPDEGFGKRSPKLVKILPARIFDENNIEPKAGMVINFPNGIKGRIQSITSGRVTVDFNHPLAGKRLKYEVEIVKKIEDKKEKIEGILEYMNIKPVSIELDNNSLVIKLKFGEEISRKIKHAIVELITKYTDIKAIKFVDEFVAPTSSE